MADSTIPTKKRSVSTEVTSEEPARKKMKVEETLEVEGESSSKKKKKKKSETADESEVTEAVTPG